MLGECAIVFRDRTLSLELGKNPLETTPIAYTQPCHRSRTHRQRQVGKTCTAISYVDNNLEGRHLAVVQCDELWFLSNALIVTFDRSIVLKYFYDIDDIIDLPSRIDTGQAVQLEYQRRLFS